MELLGCGVAGLSYCGCGVKVGGALRLCSFALLGFFAIGCLGLISVVWFMRCWEIWFEFFVLVCSDGCVWGVIVFSNFGLLDLVYGCCIRLSWVWV